MASNILENDFLVVGRMQGSFKTEVRDLLNFIQDDLNLPDPDDLTDQPGSLDDRYVRVAGDVMTGALELQGIDPVDELHATHKKYVLAQIANLAEGQVKTNKENIEKLSTTVSERVTKLEGDLSDEVDRATGAETALDKKIDALVLNDLTDTQVAAPTDNQYLVWDVSAGQPDLVTGAIPGAWVAKTPNVKEALHYKGPIDLTSDAPSDTSDYKDGDLFINTEAGPIHNTWSIPTPLNANGGELVVYTAPDIWEIVGGLGGGLTYDSFSVFNLSNPINGGQLDYNNSNGEFSFSPADMDSRIPMNMDLLPPLEPIIVP